MQRWIAHAAAEIDFLLEEADVILAAGQLHAVMLGIERLDHRFPEALAATGTPGHLRQQLERPFSGAEVGQAEADVG